MFRIGLLVSSSLLISSMVLAQTPQPAPATTPINPIMAPGAEAEPVSTPVKAFDPDESIRFGLGVFYDNGNKIHFKDYDNGSFKSDVDFDTESTWGIQGSLQYLPQDSFGIIASLNMYSKRDIKNIPAGGILSSTGPKPTLNMATLDGNLAYRWSQFYIPFGLNVSGFTYKDNGANPNIDVKVLGSIGLQFGVGYLITQNFAVDLMIKAVSFSMKTSGGGNPDETNYATIGSSNLGVRLIF